METENAEASDARVFKILSSDCCSDERWACVLVFRSDSASCNKTTRVTKARAQKFGLKELLRQLFVVC